MIVYRNKFIRILECWNGEQPDSQHVDIIRRFQQPQPINGMICRDFYTILIDLNQDQAVLFSNMKRGTCYEIRRGGNDGLVYDFWTTEDTSGLNEFCDYYDEFAVRQNQPQLRRGWFFLLAASGSLNLSRVADAGGPTLTWHCSHRTDR